MNDADFYEFGRVRQRLILILHCVDELAASFFVINDRQMKKVLWLFGVFVILASVGFITVNWYSYIFARIVKGKVVGVERVTDPSAIFNSGKNAIPANQLFSFAIAIQDAKTGEIMTSSSEDRQWAVVQKDQCVEAKYLPYPPWNIEKSGTYHGARLLRLYNCP